MDNMIVVEGFELDALVLAIKLYTESTKRPIYKLRFSFDENHMKMKINEGMWSPPMGCKQEAY